MMPSDHRGSSSRKLPNAGPYNTTTSSRGHYHKSGDSGVGSLSDHDTLAANPGGYGQQPAPSSSSSSRRLNEAKLDLEHLKAVISQLEADKQKLRFENEKLRADLRDCEDRAQKYKADNVSLSANIRELRVLNETVHTENEVLREDLRRLRSSPPRDSAASTSNSSSSGIRHRDSKRGSPGQMEEKERDQRLRDRLDGKSDKGPPSSTSGHSGHSGHSGRSRRDSFVAAPSGRPSVVVTVPVPPNSSRSQAARYATSSSRNSPAMTPSPHLANASTPRTVGPPAYPSYGDPSYFDPAEQGGGDYVHEPLPGERHAKR